MDSVLRQFVAGMDVETPMPVLFIGHGSPMNAVEENEFSQAWAQQARNLPRPKAILCISAHWETSGTRVTAMERPQTIHDFYGFPSELAQKIYPANGSPELACLTQGLLTEKVIQTDLGWGLDHGAWSVLCRMYPQADIPVVQLSLDRRNGPLYHYELGQKLRILRRKGILILGSGNIVHNLRAIESDDVTYDWAEDFDSRCKNLILTGDHKALIAYQGMGDVARLSVPTPEHFLPLLYVLGAAEEHERVTFFAEKVTLGAISMRSLRIG